MSYTLLTIFEFVGKQVMINREAIRENLYLTLIDRNYKRDKLIIEISKQIDRNIVTGCALLPYVMSSGFGKYDSINLISRRLDQLYGASLSSFSYLSENKQIFHFEIDSPSDRYLQEKENGIFCIDLLFDLIFSPIMKNGAFREHAVESEKRQLESLILSDINDKSSYCMKKALECFYKEDNRGIPSYGYLKDLGNITSKTLAEIYSGLLDSSKTEILYSGSYPDYLRQRITDRFQNGMTGKYKEAGGIFRYQGALFDVHERMHLDQDKLCLVYSSDLDPSLKNCAVLSVFNTILGASSASRLFREIREKKQLCYYCSSRKITSGACSLFIESGFHSSSFEAAVQVIRNIMHSFCENDVSRQELGTAKKTIISSISGFSDYISSYMTSMLSKINGFGTLITQEEEIEAIRNVTASDIREMAEKMYCCGLYHLAGEN